MGKKKSQLSEKVADMEARRQGSQKKFTSHDINNIEPLTQTQQALFESYNSNIPVIMNIGSAGTGKTFLSLYLALREVIESPVYDRVIIVRSAVPSRDVGFLPGSLEEKMEIYEKPYEAICDEIFKYKRNYENLKKINYVEFISSSYIRGMTLDNAIIIMDEFQNSTLQEMDSVMTRVGINSKIIFCGDIKQSDLIYKKNDVSGFGEFLNIISHMNEAAIHEFGINDIIRSGIVKSYLQAKETFSK